MDIDDLKLGYDTLQRYKTMLEREREITLQRQFEAFMHSINITDDSTIQSMHPAFRDALTILDDSNLSVEKRMLKLVASSFIYDVLRLKTNSREKELRRITHDISDFIRKSAAESDEMFIHNLLSSTLRQAADIIHPKETRQQGQPMAEAWVTAIQEQMSDIVTNL